LGDTKCNVSADQCDDKFEAEHGVVYRFGLIDFNRTDEISEDGIGLYILF